MSWQSITIPVLMLLSFLYGFNIISEIRKLKQGDHEKTQEIRRLRSEAFIFGIISAFAIIIIFLSELLQNGFRNAP